MALGLEEALAKSAELIEPVNDIFEIDPETRVVTVPESEQIFGVAADGNTERKYFRVPKVVGDNFDLSTAHIYINYMDANGGINQSLAESVETSGDCVTFTWRIAPEVVLYKGMVSFVICAKKSDAEGNVTHEWHTTIAHGTVLEGLEADGQVIAERYPDIIEQILTRLDNVTEIPEETITAAVMEYLETHPVADIPRVETSSATQELEPNKLYVFPEMESLTYTLKSPENTQVVNEYHFIFTSGATATELVHPLGVKIGSFTVDANKTYEVSILENLLTAQSWEDA